MEEYARNWWLFRREVIPVAATEYLDFLSPRYISRQLKRRSTDFFSSSTRKSGRIICSSVSVVDAASISWQCSLHGCTYRGCWRWEGHSKTGPDTTRAEFLIPVPCRRWSRASLQKLRTFLNTLASCLDSFRKARLAEHDFLTMTALYNTLERVRELENGLDMPPSLGEGERHPQSRD